MPQSTGLIQITDTWIESGGNPVQVVEGGPASIELCVSMTIDPSLIGSGYAFDINWQLVELATGRIGNNWASQMGSNSYPLSLDGWFAGGGGDYTWVIENSANNFGVSGGAGNDAELYGRGMYVLRVYIFIDQGNYGAPPGIAQWAVSDDLYFWCDYA